MTLEIKNLHVSTQVLDENNSSIEIIKGLNLTLEENQVHALMGPNGSGKSTLANVLMGDPKYNVTQGEVLFDGKSLLPLSPNERAKLGIFLSFQNPVAVPGVNVQKFLRQAYNSINPENKLSVLEFNDLLNEKAKSLGIDESFLDRYLNEGFSGGEKKKLEILQLLVLNPRVAVLDETDSGLDIDSLKIVSKGINQFKSQENKSVLIITHYKRILDYVKPDKVSIIIQGKITASGNVDLVEHLEEKGYREVGE